MPIFSKLIELIVSPAKASRCLVLRLSYLLLAGIVSLAIIFLSGCSNLNQEPISQKTPQETAKVALKPPQVVILNVDKMALDANGLILNLQAKVLNPNPSNLTIEDMKVSILGAAGLNNVQDTNLGGPIEASSVKTFSFGVVILKDLLSDKDLKIELNAKAVNGNTSLPFTNTLPLNISDILSKLIIDSKLTTQATITKISKNGFGPQLEAEVEGKVSNPNPFSLYFNAVRISIKDSKGKMIASDNLTSTSIAGNSEYSFKKTLILPIQVLNETGMTTDVETSVTIPNYSKSIKGYSAMKIPRLKDLILVPQLQIKLDSDPTWIETVIPSFLKITVLTTLKNDNELPITTGDLKINVYKPKDTLFDSSTTQSTLIQGIPGFGTKTFTNCFNFSLDKVGFSKTDSRLTAEIGLGLDGVTEKIPLSASMPLDIKPHGW
jgi:LEA14-like dessication related protein